MRETPAMTFTQFTSKAGITLVSAAFFLTAGTTAHAADKELLDMLLQNGALTQAQYDTLMQRDSLKAEDFAAASKATSEPEPEVKPSDLVLDEKITTRIEDATPVIASQGSKS